MLSFMNPGSNSSIDHKSSTKPQDVVHVPPLHQTHYHDGRTEPTAIPISRDPNDFDSEELDPDHHSRSEEEEGDQHSTHGQSTAARSPHPSTDHSHHSTHHSNHPLNQDLGRRSNHHSRHPSPHPSTTPSRPHTALDGDTTLIHQTQNGEPDAIPVHPLPTSDYKRMAPESAPPPSESVAARVNRIQKFMTDVYNLPWVAGQVTADFYPERDGRRYRGMDPDAKRLPKPELMWYPSLHKDLDLLEGETPWSAPVMAQRRQDGHRRALTESTVTPTSAAVTQSITPNTTDSPLHSLYPGPASPPMMSIPPQLAIGSSALSPRSRRGIMSSAVPVYVIPVPAPIYQP
ncbi:hypothetical protein BJ322DRAFT_1059041, partial [Thelephora terrestris]